MEVQSENAWPFFKYKTHFIAMRDVSWNRNNNHFSSPGNNWLNVLEQTNQRDFKNKNKLQKLGWRVLDVWECSLKNKNFNKAISLVERMILAA